MLAVSPVRIIIAMLEQNNDVQDPLRDPEMYVYVRAVSLLF